MTSLIKKALHSNTSYSIKQGLSDESFFLFIGRTTPWINEASPPSLQDTDSETIDILNEIYAIKRISSSNGCLVIPRYNWTTGTVYAQYSNTDDALYDKEFYVLTTDMNVYKCILNNAGAVSTVMPAGQSIYNTQTADGYTWKFMYNLSSSVVSSFLTNAYLPVPTDNQKTSNQISVETAAAYSSGSPSGGHGSNAYIELGCSRVMVSQTLSGTEGDVIDASSTYRRTGLIKNPQLISTGATATGSVYSVGDSNSDIDITSSTIMYVENRSPIQRNIDQSENIKFIINFD